MAAGGCPNCGGPLESEYSEKYCSLECFHEHHSFAGEDHPNFSGAKETTTCIRCDASFEYYPSEKEGLYCPECVENAAWRTRPDITGSSNPRWSGGKETRDCFVCGDAVVRYPSGFSGSVTVCGESCRRQWLSESFTGEGHPNWKGGGNESYGEGWRRAKLTTLERDGYTCLLCGITKDEIGRNPDVHHIVPVRTFIEIPGADKADAHVPRNLVTLCVVCHRRADFGRPSKAELKRLVDSQA